MPPEQIKRTNEEIVKHTGWGFLIGGQKQKPEADMKKPIRKGETGSQESPTPPPAEAVR